MSCSSPADSSMYQVIARKYRPATFSELISQEHVRTTLENAITQRRIAHGYILSGQRGTGKTTVARIIARCLNCINGPTATPCGECASCREVPAGSSVDVIEIDAASNRGINEMRELRENVRYRPARDRYKVFIIDEAHQITNEAFNALLKTLEEPPEWVVFILCTTEVHKIPTTIASRCQQFSFRSVDFGELISRMRWICEQEGITADEDALAVLAQAGEGSVRDSLSALDQAIACCGSTLSATEVRGLLGMFSLESLRAVTEALEQSSPQQMLEVVQELESNGRNLQHFCRELARYFRNLLVAKISGGQTRLISASAAEQERLLEVASRLSEQDLTRYLQLTLDAFKELQTSIQPRLHLEIGLLRLVHAARLVPIEQALAQIGGGAAKPSASATQSLPPPQVPKPRTGPSPFAADVARRSQTAPPKIESFRNPASSVQRPAAPSVEDVVEKPAPPAPAMPVGNDEWRTRIFNALHELGLAFTADAVEHSTVAEQNGELVFVTPKEFSLAMREADLKNAAQHAAGKPMRVKITIGDPGATTAPIAKPAAQPDDLEQRALSHPEVQRFREVFPGDVRAVRNLKE